MPEACDCVDICKIPLGQPQPIASCRGLEHQTIPPATMARATQAVLGIIGVDDRAGPGAMQAVVSPDTQKMAADIARAVIESI